MSFLRPTFILLFIGCVVGLSESAATPHEVPQLKQEEQFVIATKTPRESLSKKDLKKYLSGQLPAWPDEEPVTIVLYPKKSPELLWICKTYIKIPPETYRRFLIQKAFRSGISIVEVKNQKEARAILKKKPGAIAAIHETSLGDELHPIIVK